MRCDVGDQVGYSIRFEDLTSASTKIKFMTDGLLLREALVDPLLSRYSVIMVDEAHERSLSTDILLGVLKKILKKRQDLRIIVSSATLQAEDFVDYFSRDETDADRPSTQPRAQAIKLDGRLFPVDILYLEDPTEEYIDRAVKTVFDIHSSEPPGDILVFLTGREEIEDAIRKIAERAESIPEEVAGVLPLPMYAGLTIEQQMYIFEPAPENTRKVILSTNIAEASVTIEGIVYVVDSGFVKLRAYNPLTGVEGLTATSVSKAAATQRAGRAGRTKPGKCYRLYTEQTFDAMESTTAPEIQRSNLAPVLLQLKALGIDNVTRFDFPVAPPAELVVRALEILYSLGALNEFAKLTRPMGIRMAELSVEPMMAKVLLSASKFGCLSEMLSIAAMVSLQGAVWSPQSSDKHAAESAKRKFAAEEGDHMTLLNIYQAFVTVGKKDSKWCRNNLLNFKSMSKAVSVRNQLRRYLERFGIDVEESLTKATKKLETSATSDDIRQCLTTGFFANAARMQPDGSFKTVNGLLTLHAHPSSLMFVCSLSIITRLWTMADFYA